MRGAGMGVRIGILGLCLPVLLAALLAAQPACAQIGPVGGVITEVEKPTEPVSGSAAMGLAQAAVQARGSDITGITLLFSAPYSGRLKLEIASADGRYKGSALYDVKAAANSQVPIRFPTKKGKLLEQYGAETLALKVTGAGEDAPRYIVARYGAGVPQTLVYVNSGNSDIFLFDPETRKLRQCERVTKVPGVTFDTVCRLSATTGNRIVLRRIRGAERLDPIILNL